MLDNSIIDKLHEINSNPESSPSISLHNRHDLVVLPSQIGHFKVKHSYLLTRDDAP